jgi:predicted amidohydrolase YtcJ
MEEESQGSIGVVKRADFVIMSQELAQASPDRTKGYAVE